MTTKKAAAKPKPSAKPHPLEPVRDVDGKPIKKG